MDKYLKEAMTIAKANVNIEEVARYKNSLMVEVHQEFYMITDNGGEYTIKNLNTKEIGDIPYDGFDSVEVGFMITEYLKYGKVKNYGLGKEDYIKRKQQIKAFRKYFLGEEVKA